MKRKAKSPKRLAKKKPLRAKPQAESAPQQKPSPHFKFREQDKIGFNDADRDRENLEQCFVDTGALAALIDTSEPRCLLIGRTGAGKTALLMQVASQEERTASVQPESIGFKYITNSQVIKFLSDNDVNLDVFFRFMWRHILVVELLKLRFDITDEGQARGFTANIRNVFRKGAHKKAIQYFENYGGHYWEDTESVLVETTQKIETGIRGELSGKLSPIEIKGDLSEKLTNEQKEKVRMRFQQIVNDVQLDELNKAVDALELIFQEDPQKRYYILIDKLDEQWIDDAIRYKLIRELIETVKFVNGRMRTVKVLVGLRVDLLNRVYEKTRNSGFQFEKYQDLNLGIAWTKPRLIEVLEKRVNRLVQSRYSATAHVPLEKILPERVGSTNSIDFMIERTLLRPRDLIEFFNECIKHADGSAVISAEMVKSAEGDYSHMRFASLADEWRGDYPCLQETVQFFLKGRPTEFAVSEIAKEDCERFAVYCEDNKLGQSGDPIAALATLSYINHHSEDLRNEVVACFYKVGVLGLKMLSYESDFWSFKSDRRVRPQEIEDSFVAKVHPCLWRALNISGWKK